jgi:PAS domain S-box-containing protein
VIWWRCTCKLGFGGLVCVLAHESRRSVRHVVDTHHHTLHLAVPLATASLAVEQDIVSLCRRTRAIAEEFGLHEHDVRALSVATYEIARCLREVGASGQAELGLGDGPTLQVVVRARAIGTVAQDLSEKVAPLRLVVPDLSTSPTPDGVILRLSVPVPAFDASAPTARSGQPISVEVIDDVEATRRAVQELQAELDETNRGVVALYAELDDRAERLREAEDRLRLLLDSVQDYAIFMVNPDGTVGSWNIGAQRIFGYLAEEVIGHHFSCFYPKPEIEKGVPANHLKFAREYGRSESECHRVRKGGDSFAAQWLLTPVRSPTGELRGYSLVVRDITERKRLENDLRRRAEELSAANRAKEDFLATLSHELRTPLNAMLGWTRLLRMGKLDGAAMARALETIERNAHIQEQLIADILDVSRIVTGKLRLDLRPLELAPVVEAALDAVRPAAAAKGVQLVADTDFHGTVLGDPDRLQQVVWNLIANAIKFTPAGGRVSLAIVRLGPSAVIKVSDTGEGIPAELLPFIFDRFTQGDASVTRPHGGLGLGLSIVRHIVELHGGRVEAASDGRGLGASFAVHLPVRAIQQLAGEMAQAQPLSGVKVLVVDDDPDARESVSMALAQCGARTAAVGSAREAWSMLQDFKPDVLVSDLGMPGEDGCDFIRRVRSIGQHGVCDVPAVALTAYCQPEDQQRALTAGFQKFVPKPVALEELAAVVRSLAERRVS